MNIIMEKRKLTLLTALALTLGAGAQTTYFQTDFEEGMPEGMTFYDIDVVVQEGGNVERLDDTAGRDRQRREGAAAVAVEGFG